MLCAGERVLGRAAETGILRGSCPSCAIQPLAQCTEGEPESSGESAALKMQGLMTAL